MIEHPRRHPLYNRWKDLKKRCYNPRSKSYHNYGGRGIKVCDRWRVSFSNFLSDMGDSFTPGKTIDRIDNDGDYCKENCRWATPVEQCGNTRKNRIVVVGGSGVHLSELGRRSGIPWQTIASRLNRGMSPEDAVSMAQANRKILIEWGGERLTVGDWAKRIGKSRSTLKARFRYGWPVDRVLTTT
jgi:hypothetical protein